MIIFCKDFQINLETLHFTAGNRGRQVSVRARRDPGGVGDTTGGTGQGKGGTQEIDYYMCTNRLLHVHK